MGHNDPPCRNKNKMLCPREIKWVIMTYLVRIRVRCCFQEKYNGYNDLPCRNRNKKFFSREI